MVMERGDRDGVEGTTMEKGGPGGTVMEKGGP